MSIAAELRGLFGRRIVQLAAIAAMLFWNTTLAVLSKTCLLDNDTWWHLKVGDWIVEHLAVPHNGIFSATAVSKPWAAYSWGYEVALSRAFQWLGLTGIELLAIILTLSIAYAQFWSLRRLSGRLWGSLFLATCSLHCFLFSLAPRPVFVSILFYLILLTVLLEAKRSGDVSKLYWLPAMFLLWANIHIQVIYGLFVLGLFAACQVISRWAERNKTASALLTPASLPARTLMLIFGACGLATLIGPYGFHLYVVVAQYSKAQYTYQIINELQAIGFRHWNQFMELLLLASGFIAIGWRKRFDVFKVLLMTTASVLAFRTVRDGWFGVTTAAAMIADFPATGAEKDRDENPWEVAALLASVALFLLLASQSLGFNERTLNRTVRSNFPVDAVNFLRHNPVPGPLYNNLDWGGFLIWYLPQLPVAIDGRNELYGDGLDREFNNVQNARGYENDPYLQQAGCILLSKKYPLALVLRTDSHYVLLYEDQITTVFMPR